MRAPAGDGRRHPVPPRGTQMPTLRMAADQQRHLRLQLGHDTCAPGLGADRRRRQVRPLGVIARKAKGHRHDSDTRAVVENGLGHPHPVAQAIARAVGKGPPGLVHAHAGRLTDDQDTRASLKPWHRTWAMARGRQRKARRAKPAGRDFTDKAGWGGHLWQIGARSGMEKSRHSQYLKY